ncbi:hypothetical protein C8R46DRAFT_833490, partial [Mycena filopes]
RNTWSSAGVASVRGAKRGCHTHCCTCNISLLTGEYFAVFCRANGSKFRGVKPLLPLPPQYTTFLHDAGIFHLSRLLISYSFASLLQQHNY